MNKTWLVTGASSGLGRTMVEQLLDRGDRVVATVRRDDALADLRLQHRDSLTVVRLDLTDTDSIRMAVDAAFRRWERIDVVVSNAGYGLVGAAEELSDAQIERQIATNLTGGIQFIRAVLPHLRRQGGGRIVQISSEGGQIAYPAFSLYHATKWGIEGFVESVAQEVAPLGINFMIAEPGPTATNFGAALVMAPPIPAYEATPAGAVRRAVNERSFELKGDAGRTVVAIIAAADSAKPPFRLALGSTAFVNLTRELRRRLTEIEAQRDVALSADRDAASSAGASHTAT
ncbi:Short-chain dehydrogenase/reductase SDR [Bradyrhizobium sp. STM 3843]|uniref:SDR family oxidoreductase n=1 Tax=Bradyrhizobium sp. STM 3843 TaxID=551947 RepID=UPI000240A89A|nr:SDR family oxidoreductase [Bradyrhizobium sp. STM 3843]CCE04569.1 Short-chain dehydrogenase/reductase SDR [Bradyrhizobium sp. STM 3843]